MRIESDGHSKGNPRLFELIENAPKEGKSPTVWAWPELVDYLKIAGQPVSGPWPPHQEPRPDPDYESLPVAVPDPQSQITQSQITQSQVTPADRRNACIRLGSATRLHARSMRRSSCCTTAAARPRCSQAGRAWCR